MTAWNFKSITLADIANDRFMKVDWTIEYNIFIKFFHSEYLHARLSKQQDATWRFNRTCLFEFRLKWNSWCNLFSSNFHHDVESYVFTKLLNPWHIICSVTTPIQLCNVFASKIPWLQIWIWMTKILVLIAW